MSPLPADTTSHDCVLLCRSVVHITDSSRSSPHDGGRGGTHVSRTPGAGVHAKVEQTQAAGFTRFADEVDQSRGLDGVDQKRGSSVREVPEGSHTEIHPSGSTARCGLSSIFSLRLRFGCLRVRMTPGRQPEQRGRTSHLDVGAKHYAELITLWEKRGGEERNGEKQGSRRHHDRPGTRSGRRASKGAR
jgi:hypothetical protein